MDDNEETGRNSNRQKQRLGDFEILREIGRGGMGIVYEAVQLSLGRKVALKIVSIGLGLNRQAVARFQREAESAGRLHHTNIVPIYATGAHDGIHYYAMELIDGPSLDQVLRDLRRAAAAKHGPAGAQSDDKLAETSAYRQDSADVRDNSAIWNSSALTSGSQYFDTTARLMAEVADALAYAHREGIVHRDIKPANLLVSPEGPCSGRRGCNDRCNPPRSISLSAVGACRHF